MTRPVPRWIRDVDPRTLEIALERADGDVSRLQLNDDGTVTVHPAEPQQRPPA